MNIPVFELLHFSLYACSLDFRIVDNCRFFGLNTFRHFLIVFKALRIVFFILLEKQIIFFFLGREIVWFPIFGHYPSKENPHLSWVCALSHDGILHAWFYDGYTPFFCFLRYFIWTKKGKHLNVNHILMVVLYLFHLQVVYMYFANNNLFTRNKNVRNLNHGRIQER